MPPMCVSPRSPLRGVLFRYVDWRERNNAASAPFAGVPSAALRYRVHGDLKLDSFLETGLRCSEDLRAALAQVGQAIGSFESILDFGCGCGRTILWLEQWAQASELHGTDIDRDAISWCRRFISFARFAINEELPPLPYAEASFDLIYAVSVFTHLSEELQLRWLEELRRVARAGGYVLPTLSKRTSCL
jgi:SAM-dependent methyltransferase